MSKNPERSNRIIKGWILFLCLFAVLLSSARKTEAADTAHMNSIPDPFGTGENYSAVLYDNTNGLPTSEANDIVQTSEGFIWIGSFSGLVRYDGNTFERIDSVSSGVSSVVSLKVDSKDRLWIGTNDCGLAMMEDGKFTHWNLKDGLGADMVCDIEEGGDGNMYVGTPTGIVMVTPDMTIVPIEDPRIVDPYIERLNRGPDGSVHCITNEDHYFVLKDGKVTEYYNFEENYITGMTCILPDMEDPDKYYIGTADSDFYSGPLKKNPDQLKMDFITPLFSVIDIQKIEERIWITARNGIGYVDDKGFHLMDDLLMDNSVSHVMEDYEGNLWFTSSRLGVMKLVKNRFLDLFDLYGLEQTVVNTTCVYDNKLLIGTDTGIGIFDKEGRTATFPLTSSKTAAGDELFIEDLADFTSESRIRSMLIDKKGRLWISTWRGVGLLRYYRGELVQFTEADGLFSDHIRMICDLPDGSVAVANTGGVSVIKGDKVVKNYSRKDGIENEEILSVCAAPNGDILAGSNGAGIYVLGEAGTRTIFHDEGLLSGIVMRIRYDAKRKLYWIVTSNSLAYMTEDYKVTTISNFPYTNNFDLYENSKGDMWILSSNGIYVLPVDELIANGEMDPVHYGLANGLPCTSTSNSFSQVTDKGILYLSGNKGVAEINIEAPLEKIGDMKQAVPYMDADGVRIYPDENGVFNLSSNVKKLVIYPYVFNYSLTDPQVSYSLDGIDEEPVTVTRSDLDPIPYPNLHGGEYNFRMDLKDSTGHGNKTLLVRIKKEYKMHEYRWFRLFAQIVLALAVIVIARLANASRTRKLEIKHKQEREKERIFSELSMANRIQKSMLPQEHPPFPGRKEFEVFGSMDPAKEVGGDFFDYFLIDDDHLCLVIADVSGKGIPGALFMMVSKVILQSCAMLGQSAAEILTKTNDGICSNNKLGMFITVWVGVLEISTGKLTASNAGHEYPVIKRADGEFTLLKDKHGLVIGGMEGIKYKEYDLQLEPGDKIFVYTDGVPEATDADMNMFGTNRMLDALNADPDAAPEQILKNVRKAVDDFVAGVEQFDDLTMLCLKYNG